MSELFCPVTGELCTTQGLCEIASVPLQGAVGYVSGETRVRADRAGRAVIKAVQDVGKSLGNVDFYPSIDEGTGDVVVCTSNFRATPMVRQSTFHPEVVAKGLATMLDEAPKDAVRALRHDIRKSARKNRL